MMVMTSVSERPVTEPGGTTGAVAFILRRATLRAPARVLALPAGGRRGVGVSCRSALSRWSAPAAR